MWDPDRTNRNILGSHDKGIFPSCVVEIVHRLHQWQDIFRTQEMLKIYCVAVVFLDPYGFAECLSNQCKKHEIQVFIHNTFDSINLHRALRLNELRWPSDAGAALNWLLRKSVTRMRLCFYILLAAFRVHGALIRACSRLYTISPGNRKRLFRRFICLFVEIGTSYATSRFDSKWNCVNLHVDKFVLFSINITLMRCVLNSLVPSQSVLRRPQFTLL